MPKRGKKAKIPLSEEEQLLLFQQKLLAEEEIAKKKERLLSQFLKDKLAKEEHNSALNLNKINTQWRAVLREVKTRELHRDIEILSQTFERVVDCKDSVIKSLAKDLSEAEEQYAHALRSHLHNIDQLLALQRRRLSLLEESYVMELETLTKEFETERKTILEQHEKEIHYLQDVFMAMEQNYIDSEYESKLEFQSMWDDLKNKNLEEKHFLRLQLENIVEDLWKRFQDALKNYADATEDRKIAFETLKVKDEKSSKEIEAQMKKIQKLQEAISISKGKILLQSRESEDQNQYIRSDKELVLVQLRKLKAQRTRAREIAQENLVKLTLESNATLKALRKIVDKEIRNGRRKGAAFLFIRADSPGAGDRGAEPRGADRGAGGGDGRLCRDGELLEKVQQGETGETEPAAAARAAPGDQREAAGDAQAVLGRHLGER
ncbi:dynein regulatory complex subunit 2 isoform X3 [Lepus europaeus]|uniref:dynein regulatory complex subunit 2 isoform X3 n=1 Tax=Lepus europaeus TaxID=9983 RepID=UPI002B48EEAE|nr:dynein regulatory complex subunit 2 isoform X3 [Lepus europaeus]